MQKNYAFDSTGSVELLGVATLLRGSLGARVSGRGWRATLAGLVVSSGRPRTQFVSIVAMPTVVTGLGLLRGSFPART